MPTVSHVGVSRKIASDEERHRLKRILIHERGEASGGFIVRTAAEGASEDELRADLRFLIQSLERDQAALRIVEVAGADLSRSLADRAHPARPGERQLLQHLGRFAKPITSALFASSIAFRPTLVRRVKLYTKETPLFEHFGIQDEISKALRSKVWLKSRRLDRHQPD